MAGHVFICYARDDQDFVLKLAANLKERGVPIWLDQWHIPPGADWDRSIDDALYDCAQFLIVLSPTAVDSREVRGELRTALEESKPILPVLYRKCRIPRQLRLFQHVDFTSCAPDDSIALTQVLRALNLPEAPPSEPTETEPETVIESKVETATPDRVPLEPRRAEPLPHGPKISERKAPSGRKTNRMMIFGALIGLALLLVMGTLWYNQQQQEARRKQIEMEALQQKVRSELNRISREIEALKQKVSEAEKPQQLKELFGQKELLGQRVEALERTAKVAGLLAELEKVDRPLNEIGLQLSALERRLREAEKTEPSELPPEVVKKGRLFVETTPRAARVRILNIGPKFHQGIELAPGDYHVEVSADGYEVEKRWIGLSAGEDKRIQINLVPPGPAVEVRVTSQLVLAANDKGSGAKMNLAVYRPDVTPGSGWYWVGHCVGGKSRKSIIVKEAVADSLKAPDGYERVWTDSGSGKDDAYSLWKIKPPPGYVALGDLFFHRGDRNDYGIPREDEIRGLRCVHRKLVTQGRVRDLVWNDRGTGARDHGSVWRIEPHDNARAWDAGTIYAQGTHAKPPEDPHGVYCLLKRERKD